MSPDLVRGVHALSAQTPDMSVRSAPFRGRTADTEADNGRQERAAETRLRRQAAERRALGDARFEVLHLQRRAERSERVRAHTRAVVAARREGRHHHDDDVLPFPEEETA